LYLLKIYKTTQHNLLMPKISNKK